MILPFSTQLNGKPTYFLEKIQSGILEKLACGIDGEYLRNSDVIMSIIAKPKLHTMRADKNDRWKPGNKIHFFINFRQPDMFLFAPVLPVVSVQKVEIVYYSDREVLIKGIPFKKAVAIDDIKLNESQIKELAQNDGFDTVEAFFEYFNEDFKGKIIHWTDLKY